MVNILFIVVMLSHVDADLVNVAFSQTTKQTGEVWPSRNAVDGRKQCSVVNETFFSLTNVSKHPSWQVDLGGLFSIRQINIYGRQDDVITQLLGFQLFLSSVDNFNNQAVPIYKNTPQDYNNGIITITQISSGFYRYVKLDLPGIDGQNTRPIVLCEVEVLVNALNLASTVRLNSSSVLSYGGNNYQEKNVIDGNPSMSPDACSCCWSSADELDPWLEAVLPYRTRVFTIKAFGRTDNTHDSRILKGLTVQVDGNTVPENMTFYYTTNNTVTIYPQSRAGKAIQFTRPGTGGSWYTVICEIKIYTIPCQPGQYGPQCKTCGSCKHGTVCNSFTGVCPAGCQAGYKGERCISTCDDGYFGLQCNSTCSIHCRQGQICDKVTGACTHGCKAGYTGVQCTKKCASPSYGLNCIRTCQTCQQGKCNHTDGVCLEGCVPGFKSSDRYCHTPKENIINLLADSIKTSMSSVASNRTSNLAIDGIIGPDPDQCQCCSETYNSYLSWWIVDFGQSIPISTVIVYSRNKENEFHHLDGFQLSLSKDKRFNSSTFRSSSTAMSGKMYQISLPNILSRQIKIQRPGVLTLCEVLVYTGECEVGTFGKGCSQNCHCADNKPCNQNTGLCQSVACKTGWRGQSCDKKCFPDTFGDDCREKCFCEVGTCTSNYGICTGKCRRGYHGPHCNQVEIETKNQTEHQTDMGYSTLTVVGGAVGGSTALIAVLIVVGIIIYKFRKQNRSNSKSNYATPNAHVTSNESPEYDTLDNLNDIQTASNRVYQNERVTDF